MSAQEITFVCCIVTIAASAINTVINVFTLIRLRKVRRLNEQNAIDLMILKENARKKYC